MNPLDQKFDGCAPRRYVGFAHYAIERRLRCYGGGSSSSSTSQPVTNQQVGLETGAGAGIAVGAGSTTGAINIQTLSDAQLASLTTAASNITGGANSVAGQAIVAAQESAEHSADVVSSIAGQAVTTGAQTAQALGGATLNAATTLGTTALTTGQNVAVAGITAGENLANSAYSVTSANLNALNQNTAEAFSVLASMETSQESGAASGEAQDLLALANKLSSASSAAPTVIYQPVATDTGSQPYTGTAATGSGLSWGTIGLVAAGIAALIWGPKLLKAA